MRELPILFTAPMMLANLAGRKTVTRRTRNLERFTERGEFVAMERDKKGVWFAVFRDSIPDDPSPIYVRSPYGGPGDRLWAKETWRPQISHSCHEDACDCADVTVTYAADGKKRDFADLSIPDEWSMPKAAQTGNVSPLLMPRWASRFTVEVSGVRVERLQAITAMDAIAEGIERTPNGLWRGYQPDRGPQHKSYMGPTGSFESLWTSINGDESWAANPWVWVVEYRRLKRVKR